MEDLPREVFEMVLRYLSPLDVVPLVGCSRGLLDRLQGFEMVDCFPYYQSTLLARKDQDKCIWKWSMGKKFTLGEEWFDLHYEWYQDFPEILHTVEELKLTATGDFFPQALEGLDLFVNVRYIECEGLESMHFGPNSAQEFAKLTKLQVLRLNSTYQCFEDEDYQVLAELARRHSLIELRLNMWEKTWLEGLECAGGWLGLKHLTVPHLT
ncbi:hypothetical protein BASA81_001828 [Batrachochytrium salamandrivorans]|nr:hypothetical protein BASA81_001828 [Batrachochytrium salamandrivorans]